MKNPVSWFGIYVSDFSRAKAFCEKVFDVEMESMNVSSEMDDVYTFQMISFPSDPKGPNASGALVKAKGMEPGGSSVVVYFNCNDCSIEESRVDGAGGKVLKNKFSIGEFGYVALCMDSVRDSFGRHSMN